MALPDNAQTWTTRHADRAGWPSGPWDDDGTAMQAWESGHGDIDVHGGLTYAAACSHGEDESEGICHVPQPGQSDDVWWFGFDCSHCHDLAPGLLAFSRRLGGDQYRRLSYVVAQVESLARQLSVTAGRAVS